MGGNPERQPGPPWGRTDEWFGPADEWPGSVNQFTLPAYIIDASARLAARCAAERVLAIPGACTHISRAPGARTREDHHGGWILLAVVVFVVWFVVSLYNRLVGARNGYKNAFAQIDVQLTRRYDLIPNLVETAKGYMKHERETLEAVIKARNSADERAQGRGGKPGRCRRHGHAHRRRKRSSVRRSAGCSPWPRPIRISRPTRT